MREKYNLSDLLKEIEADENTTMDSSQKVSQNDIQKLLMQKKKKKENTAS